MTVVEIGAEIFIEPGQTPEEIDSWFKALKDNGMATTRIRMFETYMRQTDGAWDFKLFDQAFIAGEKYGIKIYANLFPKTDFSDVGGFKFPESAEKLENIAVYIKNVVQHFDQFTSLYGWVPINEPGSGDLPEDTFTVEKFTEWKGTRQLPEYNSNGFTTFELAEQRFLLHYNCWFLKWLTTQIRQYDPVRQIHVNNHDIFKNAAEYDFPVWRSFLSSLGGSAHASWHFEYFTRDKYAVAMSANAEILRSGAGDIPWFMTELQGGNNTYSGRNPMCPTKEEIAQWLWINIGSGSKGAMFWCLNPRRSGFEAGEWALLDFMNGPTDRLNAIAEVCSVIAAHQELFDSAEVAAADIHVIYTRESMWIENALQIKGAFYEGRAIGGVIKSALSYFEALSEMGIHANFKEIAEFDFNKADYSSTVIILAHQISIPSAYWKPLENFVARGGQLIVDGLTAYYDENAHCIMGPDFPLKAAFGGVVEEFKITDNLFDIKLKIPDLLLKGHLWRGTLMPSTAKTISFTNDEVTGISNTYGKGKVLWIPSLIGLGARLTDNYSGLIKLLKATLNGLEDQFPFSFNTPHKYVLMKTLKSGNSYITIIVNKYDTLKWVTLKTEIEVFLLAEPEILFTNGAKPEIYGRDIMIEPEQTIVLKWTLN